MNTDKGSAVRQIARAAAVVMMAFILSNLAGLLRDILIGMTFGTGAELDAYKAAARIPELLFNLVAGGALASAFLPAFTGFLTRDDSENAWFLASSIANLVFVILTLLGVIAAIFAPQIVRYILAPGFTDEGQIILTVTLLRIMMPSAVIFGISGLLMGILNAHQIFLYPALAPMMNSIGVIIGVVFFSRDLGIYGLAWGMNLGALLHLVVQLPSLIKLKGKYTLSLGLKFPAVREVGILMAPRLLGVAIVQLNFIVNTILASSQPSGSLAGISYAWVLMYMPQAAIAQSIAIAALPTFSAQVALGKLREMRSALAATLRGILLLSVPASLGLILLRKPLVTLLYQRGAFDSHSTDLVAWALLWYAIGLVGHSIVEIISRAYYALHDTKTPVFIGSIAMSLNVVFSLFFSKLFLQIGWAPHGGLALANSLATALEMVGLLILMRKRLGGLEGSRVKNGLWQATAGGGLMSIAILLWLKVTVEMSDWLIALGGVLVGIIIYGLTTLVLKVPEVATILAVIKIRISQILTRLSPR